MGAIEMSILPIVQRQHLRARLRPLCYFFGFAVLLAVGFWFQSPNEHLRGRMLDDGSLYPKGIFTKEQKEKGVILLDIIGVCYMFIGTHFHLCPFLLQKRQLPQPEKLIVYFSFFPCSTCCCL